MSRLRSSFCQFNTCSTFIRFDLSKSSLELGSVTKFFYKYSRHILSEERIRVLEKERSLVDISISVSFYFLSESLS